MSAVLGKDDFRRIRLSIAAAVFMIAAGASAIFAATQLFKAEEKEHAAAKAKRAEIQGQLSRAREEEMEVKHKITRFGELTRRGVLGLEQRLNWIERIRQIKNERKLLDLQYEIAPQQPIDPAILPGSSGDFEFLSSSMQFRMQLLHEEDLLNFLEDLRTSVQAFLRVRSCDIERLPKTGSEGRGPPPQLSATCTIDWITVRERKNA